MRAHKGCYHRQRNSKGRRTTLDVCCLCPGHLTRGQARRTTNHPPDAPVVRCARLPPVEVARREPAAAVLVQSGRTSYAGVVANPPRPGPAAPPERPTPAWVFFAATSAGVLLLLALVAAVSRAVSP